MDNQSEAQGGQPAAAVNTAAVGNPTTAETPHSASSRAILEDRYDGLLVVTNMRQRPFTDSDIGDCNRRWIRLTTILDELIDGTMRSNADERGDVLEAALVNLRETIVSGIEAGRP